MDSTTPGIKTVIIMKCKPVETGQGLQARSCTHWTIFCMTTSLKKGQCLWLQGNSQGSCFNLPELHLWAQRCRSCAHQRSPAASAAVQTSCTKGCLEEGRVQGREGEGSSGFARTHSKDFHWLLNGYLRRHPFLITFFLIFFQSYLDFYDFKWEKLCWRKWIIIVEMVIWKYTGKEKLEMD